MQAVHQGSTSVDAQIEVNDLSEVVTDAALWYVDTDTGFIYQRETEDGDDEDSPVFSDVWSNLGKIAPPGDGAVPGVVAGLTVTPVNVQLDDGTGIPGFEVGFTAASETDITGYEVQADARVWNLTTEVWDPASFGQPSVTFIGLGALATLAGAFIAGGEYDFRVRALDNEGFVSTWSSIVTATALPDAIAPGIPEDVQVVSGFKLLGVFWDRADDADFSFYQVRFYVTADGAGEAVFLRTKSSRVVIGGLLTEEHTVQVRSVDRSGNVATSSSDNTGLDYEANPDSGWSVAQTGTPALVGVAELAVTTLISDFITTGVLSADQIQGGTVTVGGTGAVGIIDVFEGATLIATLGPDGLVMVDPNNSDRAMWLKAGSIQFTDEYTGDVDTTTWTTAVTPDGINATAITFGTALGGANSVPNSGFELSDFVTLTTKVWTVTGDWATASSQVNLATGGNDLAMTSTA